MIVFETIEADDERKAYEAAQKKGKQPAPRPAEFNDDDTPSFGG